MASPITTSPWLRSRAIVCLGAAFLAVMLEWTAIWYRHLPTGADALWGFTWRAALLGLMPVAAYALIDLVAARLIPEVLRRWPKERLDRLLGSRPGWSAAYALLAGGFAAMLWAITISMWKDFDFPFHMPWLDWELRFRRASLEVPAVAAAGGLVGALWGWLRPRAKIERAWPPALTNPLPWAVAAGVLLAAATARRPLALFTAYPQLTRPLAFLMFVFALTVWMRGRNIPARVGAGAWAVLLGGAVAGTVVLATGLSAPSPAVLSILDANRSLAAKVWVRLTGPPVSEIQLGCATPPSGPAPWDVEVRDVVFVTVDALQGGHVGAIGYPLPTTPTINALAHRGATFTQAFSTAPATKLALPSLLYSRPYECMRTSAGRDHPTLFDLLGADGYQTKAVAGYPFDVGTTAEYAEALFRPFDDVRISVPNVDLRDTPRLDSAVADVALELLRESDPDRPLALWIHFYDPHSVYNPTREAAAEFGTGRVARYDAEIRGSDRALARVLEPLASLRGRWDPLVVVAADHGESVAEVGARGHALTLIQPAIWIPLVIADERFRGVRVDVPVSSLDVAPTILALLGRDRPSSFMGRSLLPLMTGETDRWYPIGMTRPEDAGFGSVEQRVFADGYKLVHKARPRQAGLYRTADIYELYEPGRDREERRNLIGERPEVAEAMRPLLPYRVWNGPSQDEGVRDAERIGR